MVADEVLANTEKFAQAQFANTLAVAPASTAAPVTVAAAEPAEAGARSSRMPIGRARSVAAFGGCHWEAGTAAAGSAGVELYARAASIGVLQDSVNTNATLERELKTKSETARDESERDQARKELTQIGDAKRVNQEAQAALLGRLDDAQFVAGFGSNGGEEFLSYMNISESLVVKGGAGLEALG